MRASSAYAASIAGLDIAPPARLPSLDSLGRAAEAANGRSWPLALVGMAVKSRRVSTVVPGERPWPHWRSFPQASDIVAIGFSANGGRALPGVGGVGSTAPYAYG